MSEYICLSVQRVQCRECHTTHALLLSLVVPYSQVPLADQQEILHDVSSGKSPAAVMERNYLVDENNIKHIIRELRYLRQPLHGEHTLMKFPDGRYGYLKKDRTARGFTCGDRLEAKIRDRCGNPRWIASTVEHDGTDYFLVGSPGAPMDGLTVRERW